MKRIILTGSLGQIGSELALFLADKYGQENVLVTDLAKETIPALSHLAYKQLDVTDYANFLACAKEFKADTVMHLAAIAEFISSEQLENLFYFASITFRYFHSER